MDIILKVKLYADKKLVTREYVIPYREGITLLEALDYVHEKLDPSLEYDYSCRRGVCGSCLVILNGVPVLACQTRLKPGKYTVEPPPGKPIGGLIVDRTEAWTKIARLYPQTPEAQGYTAISPQTARRLEELASCIACGACELVCPQSLPILTILHSYRITLDPRLLSEHLKKPIQALHCIQCRLCSTVCPVGIDVARIVQQALRKPRKEETVEAHKLRPLREAVEPPTT